MIGGAVLLRIRSTRAPYRRAGIEYGNQPVVLGPEHLGDGIDGLRVVVALLADPVLRVQRSTLEDEDGDFVAVTPGEVAEFVELLALAEADLAEDEDIADPEGADAKSEGGAPPADAAEAKVAEVKDAAAADPPPAATAPAADAEQSRSGGDAGPDAGATASQPPAAPGNEPAVAPSPPVAGTKSTSSKRAPKGQSKVGAPAKA